MSANIGIGPRVQWVGNSAFLNLSPHTITLRKEVRNRDIVGYSEVEIPTSGYTVRLLVEECVSIPQVRSDIEGITTTALSISEESVHNTVNEIITYVRQAIGLRSNGRLTHDKCYPVVSGMVLDAITDYWHYSKLGNSEAVEQLVGRIVSPDTSPSSVIRNDRGQIVAVKRLRVIASK